MQLGKKLSQEMDLGIIDGYHVSHNGFERGVASYHNAITTVTTKDGRKWLFNYYGTIEYPVSMEKIL